MSILSKMGILNSAHPGTELYKSLDDLVITESELGTRTKKFERHPSMRDSRLYIEIPAAAGGWSDAEVRRVGQQWPTLGMSNRYAVLDKKGKLRLSERVAELPPLKSYPNQRRVD